MTNEAVINPYKTVWQRHAFLSLVVLLIVVLLRRQELVLLLHRPIILAIVMLLFFHMICRSSYSLAQHLQRALGAEYPSVILWLYPTLVLIQLSFLSFAMIFFSHQFYGRGFWSDLLKLNGQETTRFFSTCFATMIAFTALHFLIGTLKVLQWIVASSNARVEQLTGKPENIADVPEDLNTIINRIRQETEIIQQQRRKANQINRVAAIVLFCFLVCSGCWIVFFRPAVVLYYRAEIQLQTFIEPMAAYETFKHLHEKYPNYRYMDSVKFRMAWILDRRLNRYAEAAESYKKFIDEFAPASAWSDEAYAALVRLFFDKLDQPRQAIFYGQEYLKRYPKGIFAPHIHLYRIRAFFNLGEEAKALEESETSMKNFRDTMLQIINQEDRLVEVISFNDAIKAELETRNRKTGTTIDAEVRQ